MMEELKHFSHNHALILHQLPQSGTQSTLCSGCKSLATSGNVYVYWQCSYFLHDHCFSAPRSLRHPSHPLHSLTLMPIPTYPSSSFICNSCTLTGDAFSYTCAECEFDSHLHCALAPNPNPNPNNAQSRLEHKSHPRHPLALRPAPEGFACDACGKEGGGLAYSCAACSYDLHVGCMEWPESVARPDHKHSLSLHYEYPFARADGVVFECDVCRGAVAETGWMYCCRDCEYGTHLECVHSDRVIEQRNGGEESGEDVRVQLLQLQLMRMNMNSQL